MRPDDIRDLLRREPFRPFRLVLTNNQAHEIRHPELAAVTRSLVRIGFPSGPGAVPLAERIVGIGLIHIVQYELLPATPAAGTDGAIEA
jgi:hypothetical protein